jgi:hypothetical protein
MGAQQRFHQGDNKNNTVQIGSGDKAPGEMGDEQLCVICLKNRRNAAFVPCGHLVCCCNCAKRDELKDGPSCPMCRQDIQYVLRVYESWGSWKTVFCLMFDSWPLILMDRELAEVVYPSVHIEYFHKRWSWITRVDCFDGGYCSCSSVLEVHQL